MKEEHNANFVPNFDNAQNVRLFRADGCYTSDGGVGMTEISPWRLLLLRAAYALIAFGMGARTWPAIFSHSGYWNPMSGAVQCMMGGLTLLALVGIRYPLKMLPLLFWEIAWKTIWLLVVALPAWLGGIMDAETAELTFATSLVIIIYAAVPWRYVIAEYIKAHGDSWSFK